MNFSRRTFLQGLIAAPAVVHFESLMKLSKQIDYADRTDLLISYKVVDVRSKLVVTRTVRQIMADPQRYMPYFEHVRQSIQDPLVIARQRAAMGINPNARIIRPW